MKHRVLIALMTLMLAPLAVAQDPFVEALRRYQAGELGQARALIDEAVTMPAHKENPEAWLLRGFVYKDLYKGAANAMDADGSREEALNSLFTCLQMDKDSTYKDNALQAYDYLARSCFNEAAKALNEGDEVRATALFAKYKAAVMRLDPEADLRAREAEFSNALGTVYTKRFNLDRTQLQWFEEAVDAYKSVLVIDAENYGANYNLATLYYNLGVHRIRAIKADDDIPSIQQIQEAAREYFNLALPFMLKAHDMNPTRRETLLGLEGIYYSLQDEMNSEKFRQLYELLPPGEDR